MVPTQSTLPSTVRRQTPQEVPNTAVASDVIEISSGESNATKRKLMSRETESDFFEDHLIEMLDAGKY